MKKTKILYWVFTILFALLMLASAVPDIIISEDALKYFSMLRLPEYLLPFLGVAKTLGVIAILVPGYPRVTEWAYAGLFFDLIGAAYCTYASTSQLSSIAFMLLPVGLGVLSYIFYHKRRAIPAIH